MSNLENKIRNAYGNADELIDLVRKVDLEKSLNIILGKIEAAIQEKNIERIVTIAGPMLSGINSKLGPVANPEEKQKIEYLLADIFEEYLVLISNQSQGQMLLSQVDENLKETCEIAGYDYTALSNLFNIKKHVILLPQLKINNRHYYEWSGVDYELDGIIRDIADKKWIYSVKEMKRLFAPVDGSLQIRCDVNKKSELLLLIHLLKEKGLILPKGKGNSGHFKPFCTYAVDNDGNFLFKNAVNKFHHRLKSRSSSYEGLRAKALKVIINNATKSLEQ